MNSKVSGGKILFAFRKIIFPMIHKFSPDVIIFSYSMTFCKHFTFPAYYSENENEIIKNKSMQ